MDIPADVATKDALDVAEGAHGHAEAAEDANSRRSFNKRCGHAIREYMNTNVQGLTLNTIELLNLRRQENMKVGCWAYVPYLLDPAYLTCFLAASALHEKDNLTMGPIFLKLKRILQQACGKQYNVFAQEAYKLYKQTQDDPEHLDNKGLFQLKFDCEELIFPAISTFGDYQSDVRMFSVKLHEFLLRNEITMLPITPTGTLYSNLPLGSIYINEHTKQLKAAITTLEILLANPTKVAECTETHFYLTVRKLLCVLIDLVLVRRIFRCKYNDFQEILIDWFCNDYDVFWSDGSWELIERLVLQYSISEVSGNTQLLENHPWNQPWNDVIRLHLLKAIYRALDLEPEDR